jgi:hypothetical protein
MKNKCCICKKVFNSYGHNPQPIKKKGRCCDKCNIGVLLEKIRREGEGKLTEDERPVTLISLSLI